MGCGLFMATPTTEVFVSHGNASLTVHGRRLIVQRFQDGWRTSHIAAAMGVSRKCVTTWITRYQAEGEAGLRDRSSRPHTMPTRTPEEIEQKVLAARAADRQGPDVLGPKLGVAPRTVSRILRRHNVAYLRDCDPMTGEVIRTSKATAVRYEPCPARRTGAHGRQEAGQDPRWWRLEGARPGKRGARPQSQNRIRLRPLAGR